MAQYTRFSTVNPQWESVSHIRRFLLANLKGI